MKEFARRLLATKREQERKPTNDELLRVWNGETNHSNKRKVIDYGLRCFEMGQSAAPPQDALETKCPTVVCLTRTAELIANGERLKAAADSWQEEANRLRGVEAALRFAEAALAKYEDKFERNQERALSAKESDAAQASTAPEHKA